MAQLDLARRSLERTELVKSIGKAKVGGDRSFLLPLFETM
jgi:hypothetical protein